VRGVDPPRIDQLISQGYGVFGRIEEFLESNEKTLSVFLGSLNRLMLDLQKVIDKTDQKKLAVFLEDLYRITGDIKTMTAHITGPDGQKAFEKITELIDRAHEIDKDSVKKFFQEEGIRARVF
jgi:phospholipid/cholesterol/gamma-HCH transport system substrate-binding protein